MTHGFTSASALAGLLILGTSLVPAAAGGGREAPLRLADMMEMQPPANPGAGMADDKIKDDGMGMKPAPAAPGAAMAPAQPGGAPDAAGMKGGMGDDGMGMQPMTPAQPQGAPGGGMKPGMGDDKMVMPGGCCMPKMQPPGGMAATPGGMAGTAAQPTPMLLQAQPSAPLDHMEGRIAFLRAELGITAAQSPVWDQFAQALRSGREHQGVARQALVTSSGSQYGAADRLEAYERHLALRLESLRTARESFQRLYVSMNAAQKQNADLLVLPVLVSF